MTNPSDDASLPVDGGSADGGSNPTCSGKPILSDGALDVDLRSVQVSGHVTRNGTPLPSQAALGHLSFIERSTKATVTVSIVSGDAANYRVVVEPGVYDVLYENDNCSAAVLPCGSGPIKQNVALGSDGVLDLDIPAVRVTGKVTSRGGALPSNESAILTFSRTGGGHAQTTALNGGSATYALTVLPGSYTVSYSLSGTSCQQLPCNSGPLEKNVSLTSDGALDVDIPAVKVTGNVTLNGGTLPANESALLNFNLDGGNSANSRNLAAGSNTYALTLLPGSYTISYGLGGTSCQQLPCNSGPLEKNVSLTSDGALDVDIPAVKVTGNVTLNGGTLPANESALLNFNLDGGNSANSRNLAAGSNTYALTLLPGSYTVSYRLNGTSCQQLPCNDGPLKRSVSLTSGGALDVDIPAAKVTGDVTLRGAPLPTEAADRGQLSFALNDGGAANTSSFGTTGAVHYAISLLPGKYVVQFSANAALCSGARLPQVPCIDELVAGCP